MTRRICLVTDELHPFTAGGIGRLLHNVALDSLERSPDLEIHFLLPSYLAISRERVSACFGERVQAHFAEMREGWDPSFEEGATYPPAAALTDTVWHAKSLDFLRALKRLRRFEYEVIEFPDYHGLAFCALQEKLLGLDFARTEIAVRVHSTDGVLGHFEPRDPTIAQAGLHELERKALRDADRVVAHLRSVARFNADYYGFDETWLSRVTVAFPPVVHPRPPAPREKSPPRDLLFCTKLQSFKRPDVFVRGAAQFLRAVPEFKGRAVLACHAADPAYADRVRNLVPSDLADRFVFLPPGPERDALQGSSIVVIPSSWESLNLVAYEAAAAGAVLVLNERSGGFGDDSPFRDGENCYKFDGSVEGLAAALERAFRQGRHGDLQWTADPPYWLAPRASAPAPTGPRRSPLVSVVIPNHNLALYLPETLASIAASTYREVEVVLVDDSSTSPLDASMLDRIAAKGRDTGIQVIRNPVNRGLSASRNIGIAAAKGEYVLPLDADDCISPTFLELAVNALEARPGFDVVVPSAAYFETDAGLSERRFPDYALFVGDAPSLGLIFNRLSCATSLLRRSLFERHRYDETLDSFEDWALYLRLAHEGRRFLVTNQIHFHYRKRPRSMISSMTEERHLQLLARILESLPKPLPRSLHLPALLGPTLQYLQQRDATREQLGRFPVALTDKPLRYTLADAVNAAIKKTPGVRGLHGMFKASVGRLVNGR